jgi:hypothetical protein
MAWVKGKSGNPKGRPRKERALTAMLERAGGKRIEDPRHGTITQKDLLTRLLWEGLSTGAVTFPNGRVMELDAPNWAILSKWLFAQVDGPPPQAVRVGGPDGEPLESPVVILIPDNGRDDDPSD